jgi:mRNA-degrading endonuclease toxin of MazEF toxin-antitoxin module
MQTGENVFMSHPKTKDEYISHKDITIQKIDAFMTRRIEDGPVSADKVDKLAYWLEDYIKFLEFEPQFKPTSLKRYKRGEILKVHLGYNIGSEEGGLHYAVVLDNDNSIYSPVITVVPLTSVKSHTDTAKLHKGNIFLGNEIFTSMSAKLSNQIKSFEDQIQELAELSEFLSTMDDESVVKEGERVGQKIDVVHKELVITRRIRDEVQRMKAGSIALVAQITTISKIRIFDPKTMDGALAGIKLSNEKLDEIDLCLKALFTYKRSEKIDNEDKKQSAD